jgi:hypothetical protein
MKRFMKRFSTVALAAALAACQSLHWTRDGADERQIAADLDACRQQARIEAFRLSPPSIHASSAPPIVVRDRDGRAVVAPPPHGDAERVLLEHDLTRACMQRKGYALVPVVPAAR